MTALLRQQLQDPSWVQKVAALHTLATRFAEGKVDDAEALESVLVAMASDAKWEVRKGLAITLGELAPGPRVQRALEVLAHDANHWVRQAAVRAVRRQKERELQPEWTLSKVHDPMLQHVARRIREIGPRSMTPALLLDLANELGERSYRELAADTAHEIRTMLTPLEGYLVALHRHLDATAKADDKTRRYVELTLARVHKLHDFTEDLRTYSSSGESQLIPTSLAALVTDAIGISFEHVGEPANIERRIDVSDVIVEVVPERLTRAIANVVTNALQAMPTGGILHVSASLEGKAIVLTIRDTGHGMTPEMVEKARSRFTTTRKDQGGTGLGLPIVERIVVTDHCGELLVDSTPGVGTTVTIRLPRKQ